MRALSMRWKPGLDWLLAQRLLVQLLPEEEDACLSSWRTGQPDWYLIRPLGLRDSVIKQAKPMWTHRSARLPLDRGDAHGISDQLPAVDVALGQSHADCTGEPWWKVLVRGLHRHYRRILIKGPLALAESRPWLMWEREQVKRSQLKVQPLGPCCRMSSGQHVWSAQRTWILYDNVRTSARSLIQSLYWTLCSSLIWP